MSNHKGIMWDISGAFGDIGVLLPMAIILIGKNGFNPTAFFLCAGLFYILSAGYFKVTMPVQPLKAMSAIAIAAGLGPDVISAAGIAIGVIFLVLALSGASSGLGSLFPEPVIRGIQLGLGLLLMKSSFGFLNGDYVTAAVAIVILMAGQTVFRRIPALVPIMLGGFIIAAIKAKVPSIGPLPLTAALPGMNTLIRGITVLVLPQLALSFGNAIVAAEATGKMLYRERAKKLSLKTIPLSMGIANIFTGLVGGFPMCHGSGGITAHYSFGARGEKSGYIIGGVLVAAALFLGRSELSVLSSFPKGILGVMLCYVGLQHMILVKGIIYDRKALAVAVSVASISLLTTNLTEGFIAGIAIHYCLRWAGVGSGRMGRELSNEVRS